MFDLFGWLRKRVSDSFTGGIADGLKAAGVAPNDVPPELAAMHKATTSALPAKEDRESPEPERRKTSRSK